MDDMIIYIVIEITYDYYEFQNLLYASTSVTKINKYLHSEEFKKDYLNFPIYWAGDDHSDCAEKEKSHIYIEEIEDNLNENS